VLGPDVPGADPVGDAMGDRPGLARAGAREDAQGAGRSGDHGRLLRVKSGEWV
jgi:hypothetical protein